MSARDTILKKVRNALVNGADDATRRANVADRLQNTPEGIIPKRAKLPEAERVALFIDGHEQRRRAEGGDGVSAPAQPAGLGAHGQ
jgi:hypothetical protein